MLLAAVIADGISLFDHFGSCQIWGSHVKAAALSLLGCVGEDPSCRDLERRSSGSLQGFAESLLRRVPFNLLEAQVGS